MSRLYEFETLLLPLPTDSERRRMRDATSGARERDAILGCVRVAVRRPLLSFAVNEALPKHVVDDDDAADDDEGHRSPGLGKSSLFEELSSF